ncbi:MAG: fatty acid desaturase [Phycisphaerales bacterium]|nr:fatty acid desaturase [Phycisphaerales bacterium]
MTIVSSPPPFSASALPIHDHFGDSVLPDAAPPAASTAASRRAARKLSPAERKLRLVNLIAVSLPFVGLLAAVGLLWGVAFDWTYLAILWGMAAVSSIGITVGYHRLFTHKSFKTNAVVRYALGAAGAMAVQGPVIEWCGTHRRHHQHSDHEEDPHSPHIGPHGSWGDSLWSTLRGAWRAHVGWMLEGRPKGLGRYTRDLREDPATAAANRHFTRWVLAGLIIPAVLGGVLTMSWTGIALGFLWGGLVRIFLVHHITWSVNSVCHLWGTQPFRSHDESRNNPIVGVLGLGEGWHNNHHAFPTSARHGLRWWELDLSYLFILGMKMVGLATDIRKPDRERMDSKRRKATD